MNKDNKDMVVENEVAVVKNCADLAPHTIDELTNVESSFFCSIKDDGTRASKIKIYNALNTQGEQLSDHINEELEIVDISAHTIMVVDNSTGELTQTLRTVLIAKDGITYQAVSSGVISSLQKIFAIVGFPSWVDEPVIVKPVNVKTNNGFKVLTLELV